MLRLFKIVTVFLFLVTLFSCGQSEKVESVSSRLELSGSMLFAGANTLQADASAELSSIMSKSQVEEGSLEAVKVSSVTISVRDDQRDLFESFLLQIVSDQNDLVTIGTLSPLPDANTFSLSMAEETDVLKYLKDKGATWVLDANFSQDYMDELSVTCKIDYDLY
jgi:hypothetical protein